MNIATARRTDPVQCHAAADRMNDGRLTEHEQYALDYIARYPGRSAQGLEYIAGCKPGKIWKRIKGLVDKGAVIRTYEDGCREAKLYVTSKNKIRYELSLFEPDKLKCVCGRIWTACGIATMGGYVTCPNCNATAYMPEREHYS
jgi:hypothetical protein